MDVFHRVPGGTIDTPQMVLDSEFDSQHKHAWKSPQIAASPTLPPFPFHTLAHTQHHMHRGHQLWLLGLRQQWKIHMKCQRCSWSLCLISEDVWDPTHTSLPSPELLPPRFPLLPGAQQQAKGPSTCSLRGTRPTPWRIWIRSKWRHLQSLSFSSGLRHFPTWTETVLWSLLMCRNGRVEVWMHSTGFGGCGSSWFHLTAVSWGLTANTDCDISPQNAELLQDPEEVPKLCLGHRALLLDAICSDFPKDANVSK